MENMKVFYRAFKAYKEAFGGNKMVTEFRNVLKKSTKNIDSLNAVRTYAIVEEDWVKTIEEEMYFVEKAIREDRQFIRENGEVIPIEKVKRVSPASVKHLARHSELLSKDSVDGENLIPDELYIVEKLTDYAVYENRFLYMLLNYVRDFITIRLDKIIELGMTYKSDLQLKKDVSFNHRHFYIETVMRDENKRDMNARGLGNAESMIARLKDQLGMVIMLLNTPLMQEVSKVPMIKPPITKTNVLRMNNNFKHALELYHYLVEYNKAGYEIKEIKNLISPFSEKVLEEFSEAIILNSFISYQYGNKLSEVLHAEFLKEEERRRLEQNERDKQQLEDLKKRIKESGKTKDEYILALEKRNAELEGDRSKNIILGEKNKQLIIEVERLNNQVKENLAKIESLTRELEFWPVKYEKDMAGQKLEYETKIGELTEDYENQLTELKEDYENQLEEQKEGYEQSLSELEDNWQNKFNETVGEYDKRIDQITANAKAEHDKLTEEKAKAISANGAQAEQVKQLIWRYEVLTGENNALRNQLGLIPAGEDFTEKERFLDLERQFEAFTILFNAEWEKTKKRIKKEIMSVYPQKKLKKLPTEVDEKGECLKADNTYKEEQEQVVEIENTVEEEEVNPATEEENKE